MVEAVHAWIFFDIDQRRVVVGGAKKHKTARAVLFENSGDGFDGQTEVALMGSTSSSVSDSYKAIFLSHPGSRRYSGFIVRGLIEAVGQNVSCLTRPAHVKCQL